MSLINPSETMIKYMLTQGTSLGVGSRISGKNQFGDVWKKGETYLVVRLDDAELSNDVPLHASRFEVRIYGASQAVILGVWVELLAIFRDVNRNVVVTDSGDALLHSVLQSSGPSLLYDDEIEMDYLMQFFTAIVGDSSL